MKKALTAAMIAGATMSTAFAADLPSRKAPVYIPPPPLMTWTGFHVGVNAGGIFGGRNSALTIGAPVANTFALAGLGTLQNAATTASTAFVGLGNRTGAILGVQAGYDYQFATSFLVGIEADAQGVIAPSSRGLFSVGAPFADPALVATAVSSVGFVQKRTDWLGTVRARLGYTVTPSFLIYATGGLAFGGVKSSTGFAEISNAGNSTFTGSFGGYSTNRVGYAVGGGVEYMFLPNFSLKAEYLYYDLGTANYNTGLNVLSVGAAPGFGTNINRTRVRFDGNLARIGVNYHFWAPPASAVVARY